MKFYELDEGTVFRFADDHEDTVRVTYSRNGKLIRSMLLKDGRCNSEDCYCRDSDVMPLNILKTEPILT